MMDVGVSTERTSDNASMPTIRTGDRREMYRKGQDRTATKMLASLDPRRIVLEELREP
jgi:hypothetical protein